MTSRYLPNEALVVVIRGEVVAAVVSAADDVRRSWVGVGDCVVTAVVSLGVVICSVLDSPLVDIGGSVVMYEDLAVEDTNAGSLGGTSKK